MKTRASIRFRHRTQREFFVCTDTLVCLFLLPLATYIQPRSSSEALEDYVRILRRLNAVKEDKFFDGLDIFDKTEVLLSFLDRPTLKKGDRIIQDVKFLVQLRNALIHTRSEGEIHLIFGESGSFDKIRLLEAKLKGRFKFKKLKSEAYISAPSMQKIFTPECALWAVGSAANYWNFIAK